MRATFARKCARRTFKARIASRPGTMRPVGQESDKPLDPAPNSSTPPSGDADLDPMAEPAASRLEKPPPPNLSDAVQKILQDAEARVGTVEDTRRPFPHSKSTAELPGALLAGLDDHLLGDWDSQEEESTPAPPTTSVQDGGTGTSPTGESVVTGLERTSSTGDVDSRETSVVDRALTPWAPTEDSPELNVPEPGPLFARERGPSTYTESSPPSTVPPKRRAEPPGERVTLPAPEQAAQPESPASSPPTVWTPPASSCLQAGEAPKAVARAIRERFTGALAVETENVIRRIVLRDGDLVTVASSSEKESLIGFLVGRGSLREETGQSLERRVPRFGRHAAAALIANGQLTQDQLWPVLRGHADWLLSRILRTETGALSFEAEMPATLSDEPTVYGRSSGAAAFLEGVLRAFSPSDALARLGSASSHLESGPATFLAAECDLTPEQQKWLDPALVGRPVHASDVPPKARPVLYALFLLGVLRQSGAGGPPRGLREPKAGSRDSLALDVAAIRERVAARLALVQEGDYYAVLGIRRGATHHEIAIAYENLRQELDPASIINARTADLSESVNVILEVLEEAFEILSDPVRRERYLKAISAQPVG